MREVCTYTLTCMYIINFFKSVSWYCILAKCVNVSRGVQAIAKYRKTIITINHGSGEGRKMLKMINYVHIEKKSAFV